MTTLCMTIILSLSTTNIDSNLIKAIEQKESSSQSYPKGWNDGGKAKGWFQCHKDYWQDGCRFAGVKWAWNDAHNREKSTKIVIAYLEGYGKQYTKETGKKPTLETYALIHHFGPKGWKNKDKRYWYDIQKIMKSYK